jgi:hypothetical protein
MLNAYGFSKAMWRIHMTVTAWHPESIDCLWFWLSDVIIPVTVASWQQTIIECYWFWRCGVANPYDSCTMQPGNLKILIGF